MRLGIVSDTHLPRGSRALPADCLERLAAADAILHAGDFIELSVLEQLQALGPPVHAVRGNVDSAELQARLPLVRTVEAAGARIAMIHDAGPADGRLAADAPPLPGRRRGRLRPLAPAAARGARRLRDLQPGLADRAPPRAPPHDGDRHGRRTAACAFELVRVGA